MNPEDAKEVHHLQRRIEYLTHPNRDPSRNYEEYQWVLDDQFSDVKSRRDFAETLTDKLGYSFGELGRGVQS